MFLDVSHDPLSYWDWADQQVATEGLPEVLYSETVTLVGPEGDTDDVVNPFSYFPISNIPPDFTNVTTVCIYLSAS